jgi:hypothetical protein
MNGGMDHLFGGERIEKIYLHFITPNSKHIKCKNKKKHYNKVFPDLAPEKFMLTKRHWVYI